MATSDRGERNDRLTIETCATMGPKALDAGLGMDLLAAAVRDSGRVVTVDGARTDQGAARGLAENLLGAASPSANEPRHRPGENGVEEGRGSGGQPRGDVLVCIWHIYTWLDVAGGAVLATVAAEGTGKPDKTPPEGALSEIKNIDRKAYAAAIEQAQGKIDSIIAGWPE